MRQLLLLVLLVATFATVGCNKPEEITKAAPPPTLEKYVGHEVAKVWRQSVGYYGTKNTQVAYVYTDYAKKVKETFVDFDGDGFAEVYMKEYIDNSSPKIYTYITPTYTVAERESKKAIFDNSGSVEFWVAEGTETDTTIQSKYRDLQKSFAEKEGTAFKHPENYKESKMAKSALGLYKEYKKQDQILLTAKPSSIESELAELREFHCLPELYRVYHNLSRAERSFFFTNIPLIDDRPKNEAAEPQAAIRARFEQEFLFRMDEIDHQSAFRSIDAWEKHLEKEYHDSLIKRGLIDK